MDTKQLNDALDRLFKDEGQRVVFWNDPDKEFVGTIPFLMLDGVEVLQLDKVGSLEAKLLIEQQRPADQFLIYSPTEEPDYEEDWLLDIRLYSRSFRADRASITLSELGLANQQLHQHIKARRKFFDNKERIQKLRAIVTTDDNAADLDRKMLALVTKAEQPELFNIVRTLFHAFTEQDVIDLGKPPAVWEQIEKFELDEPFWLMVKTVFGYTEDAPSLGNFLVRLFLTDYAQHLKAAFPTSLLHLQLPAAGRSNAVVCLAQWRDSSSRASSYDLLAAEVAHVVKLSEHLHDLEIDALLDVMTFLDVEKAICRSLKDRVQSTAHTINADEIRKIATRRQAGHWASTSVQGADSVPRSSLNAVYVALTAAADFLALRNQYRDGFSFDDAQSMYGAYEQELHRFDLFYRQFCEAAAEAKAGHLDILKDLNDEIEACYVNWYSPQLSLTWGKFVAGGLLKHWQIAGVPNQQQFFNRNVRLRLEEADNRKAFVIISDALRYEVAQELTQELNGKYRFQAELTSQLGVLPSYTALGMASLLPHQKISYKSKDVLVDGKPTSSLDLRSNILASVEGVALKANDLLSMKKEEGRELVAGKRVIYIYHNVIDATGDDSKSEGDTFKAVRQTINDLGDLVKFIVNSLNGNFIVVTADHGFLFTETAANETDKSKLSTEPPGTVLAKKRYLLGLKLPDVDEAWHGKTSVTAGAEGDMEFLIPKGTNRFHLVGGSRYFHGGAMLPEVVVPIITVRHMKGKAAQETKTKQVLVHVLGAAHKITTAKHRFELIQMEPVSDRVKPITHKVAVYEADEPVTNIETVTFDSQSSNMDDRKKSVTLVLRERKYNKKSKYRLVLRDADTDIEQQSVDVIIDRAFTDDF